jgi:hypothetical protein
MNATLRSAMHERLSQYLNEMLQAVPPSSSLDSGTVFSGVGGRAMLLLKLHAATANRAYIEMAAPYVARMERLFPEQEVKDAALGYIGFLWSSTGMHCIAAVFANLHGDAAGVAKHVGAIRNRYARLVGKYDDLDSGRAGLLYAARFLDANLPPTGVPYIEPRDVLRLANAIVDRGAQTGASQGRDFLMWHGPNDRGLWLGMSHGSAGVLSNLLAVPTLLANGTARAWIRRTLDHIVSVQFPSGNFPTEYYNSTADVLVQWDHGAPGVSAALLAGWKAFGAAQAGHTAVYRASAERALNATWTRGLLFKGLMSCHGIGGNTWMLLNAYQATGDETHLYRALAFQHTVLATPLLSALPLMRRPQPGPGAVWSFWTGSVESAIFLWTDLLYRPPMNASMTGWSPAL